MTPNQVPDFHRLAGIIAQAGFNRNGPLAAERQARAVIDAGYRKRRTISSVEEANELPDDSVIRTQGVTLEKAGGGWYSPGTDFNYTPHDFWFEAPYELPVVLFDPRGEES